MLGVGGHQSPGIWQEIDWKSVALGKNKVSLRYSGGLDTFLGRVGW